MNKVLSIASQQNIKQINSIRNTNAGYINNSAKISFCGSKSDAALRLLDSTIDNLVQEKGINIINRMKFHKILNEAIPALITPENYINAGRESKVYRISDKYVAKIRRGFYSNNSINFLKPITMPSKKYSELDAYYGEPIISHGKIEILKNATPKEGNIFCGIAYKGERVLKTSEIQKYEKEVVPACSSIPQESYDELAFDLKKINKMHGIGLRGKYYYTPDIINPNNILISNNKFKIVDKLDKVDEKNPNSLFTMLEPLLLRMAPEDGAKYNEELVSPRMNILKKCLIASEKAELPLDSAMKWEFSEWTLSEIIPGSEFVYNLAKLRKDNVSLGERLEFINKSVAEYKNPKR